MRRLPMLLALLALLSGTQLSPADPVQPVTVGVAPPYPADWVEISAGDVFTMNVPPGTVMRKAQGLDSFASGFDGPGFKMAFDYGLYSYNLRQLMSDPRYTSEQLQIDGNPAIMVSGPAHLNEFACQHYLVALHVTGLGRGGEGENTLTVGACVATANDAGLARAMLESIKFQH